MGNTANDSIREEYYAKRKDEIVRLRTKDRLSWEAIGERVGLTRDATSRVFSSAMTELGKADRDRARAECEARLDALLDPLWPFAITAPIVGPDDDAEMLAARFDLFFRAQDRALKIEERRARLLGLDMPAKAEITGKDGGPIAVVSLEHLSALIVTAKANENDDAVGAGTVDSAATEH